MMAQFAVLTRLKEPENSSLYSKMRVYDGENLKDTDPRAKSYQEYRDYAGVDEGMSGVSTRFAFKIISKVFNFDDTEVAANPVHLMYVLEEQIEREQFRPERNRSTSRSSRSTWSPRYAEFIGKEIQTAYLESYRVRPEHLRSLRHLRRLLDPGPGVPRPDTGEVFDRAALNAELEKIEKPAGISNPKDFRNEVVNFVLRARANNAGKNPAVDQLREAAHGDREEDVLEHRRSAAGHQLQRQGERRRAKKHEDFVNRMVAKGYTPKQVRLLCEWYLRVRKSS
jgi:serine protein kinase